MSELPETVSAEKASPQQLPDETREAPKLNYGRVISRSIVGLASLVIVAGGVLAFGLADRWMPAQAPEDSPYTQIELSNVTIQQICPPVIEATPQTVIMPDGTQGQATQKFGFGTSSTAAKLTTLTGAAVSPTQVDDSAFIISGENQSQPFISLRADSITGAGHQALSSTQCRRAASITWLSGAATDRGNTADLILVNPAPAATEVTITGWGASGPLPSIPETLVAGKSVKRIKLAGQISEAEIITLKVETDGPAIGAFLATTRNDGLVSHGREWAPALPDPARKLVLAGTNLSAAGGTLWITNPGEETTSVTVSTLSSEGLNPVAGAEDLTISAGSVLPLDLGGIQTGLEPLFIESTQPIAATALTTQLDEDPTDEVVTRPATDSAGITSDYALVGVSQQVTHAELVVPQGIKADLLVVNPHAQVATLKVGGVPKEVPAQSSTTIALPSSADFEADRPLYAAVQYRLPNGKAAISTQVVKAISSVGGQYTLDTRP
ncbi:DUF5719 family protein [Boudabousia marimammalium]|uniref:Large extracellular alpha-helical protein n=1 Tax=Boudabousia marimammalium TaxID=156892 RepID=A0A1Q5PS03_9ACTO|nr:DUF5719 family protein [Boudabousia marimammalium]OKL50212.1 hypothetical protein BM477_02125 [Boudabousia marimammalium]